AWPHAARSRRHPRNGLRKQTGPGSGSRLHVHSFGSLPSGALGASFDLDVGFLGDAAPALHFARHVGAELLRRAADGVDAVLAEPAPHGRVLEQARDIAMQLLDNLR